MRQNELLEGPVRYPAGRRTVQRLVALVEATNDDCVARRLALCLGRLSREFLWYSRSAAPFSRVESQEVALYGDLSIFTGNAHPELARAVCRYLGVGLGKADVFEFTNENIFVKINQNVREQDVFVIQPTYPDVNRSVMELLIMLDALKRASASRVTAVIPYFAYGRSDKKDQPRVPITARLLADMIQVAGADRVLTGRPPCRSGPGVLQNPGR